MKKILYTPLIAMVALIANAQPGYFRLHNGNYITLYNLNQKKALIAEIGSNLGGANFKKFSDGTVDSITRVLYQKEGILPRIKNGVQIVGIGFKVEDVTDAGCRIRCVKEADNELSDNDIFIKGLTGFYSGRSYKLPILLLKHDGDFTYKTVNGATRVIPQFEFGTDITKEEYTKKFKIQNPSI